MKNVIYKNSNYPVFSTIIDGKTYYQIKLEDGVDKQGETKYKIISVLDINDFPDEIAKVQNSIDSVKKELKFENIGNKWLEEKYSTVAAVTFDKLESVYRVHLLPRFKDKIITDFDENLVRNYIKKIATTKNQESNIILSFYTVKKIKSVLSDILEYACCHNYLNRNFCRYVDVEDYAKLNTSKRKLPEEDVNKILEIIEHKYSTGDYKYHYKNLIKFQIESGLKVTEIALITKDMINFKNNTILIEGSVNRTKNRSEDGIWLEGYTTAIVESKKKKKIKITPKIEEILKEQLKDNKSEFVFPNSNGDIINPSTYAENFKKLCDKAGVDLVPNSLCFAKS